METEAKVKSLKKAIDILDCFNIQEQELGITEISQKLDLYKSNVHNLVSTLEQSGYLQKNPLSGKYHLGMKFLEKAFLVNANMGIHALVHPYLQQLSDDLGEVVYFAIPKGPQILYLEGVYPASNYRARSIVGETAEMYCTALGKSILAFMPADLQAQALAGQSMRAYTPQTLVSKETLLRELDQIRRQGFSMDNMEHEYGIKCVGVPVFKHDGSLMGAISISGPSLRIENRIEALANQLKLCSQQMSLHL